MTNSASPANVSRCAWVGSELNRPYHDTEWGVPVHDDRKLFEFIILEGAQAGLSWETILRKRECYRSVMDGFDPQKIAVYGDSKISELLSESGIIRNRLKVLSAITNAQAFLKVVEEFGTFDSYIWGFVDGQPIINRWSSRNDVPAVSPVAESMAKDLKKRGFKFMGPTICYAHMQATGMVNDHTTDCFRWKQVQG